MKPPYRLGIDLGGTTTTALLLAGAGEVVAESTVATGDHAHPRAVIGRLARLAAVLLERGGVGAGELAGIGVGLPGEVEPERGLLRASPILPTWRRVEVARMLGELSGAPVWVDNDANTAALAEHRLGAGRGADPLLLLTIGTGIGGALVVNGGLLRGCAGSAGEIGHLSVAPGGPRCWCGGRGCLGLLASTSALIERYRGEAGLAADAALDGFALAAALRAGDAAARRAVESCAALLARGIADAACVVAPRRVVLAGGILALGDELLDPIRRHLRERSYPAVLAACEVVAAELGSSAGAVGAALLVPGAATAAAEGGGGGNNPRRQV